MYKPFKQLAVGERFTYRLSRYVKTANNEAVYLPISRKKVSHHIGGLAVIFKESARVNVNGAK
jgi:hypothetical protein